VRASSLRNGSGRRAYVAQEQASKVARANAEPLRETVDVSFVERPFGEKPQGSRDQCRSAHPHGRAGAGVGPTAHARSEAVGFGGGCATKKLNVLSERSPCRTDRSAVNSGGPDTDEDAPVVTGVPRAKGAVALIGGQRHAQTIVRDAAWRWPFSDLDGRGIGIGVRGRGSGVGGRGRDSDLARQLRRSSSSVGLNAAEGLHARAGNRTVRIESAMCSGRETIMALRIAAAAGYLAAEPATAEARQIDRIVATLYKLAYRP